MSNIVCKFDHIFRIYIEVKTLIRQVLSSKDYLNDVYLVLDGIIEGLDLNEIRQLNLLAAWIELVISLEEYIFKQTSDGDVVLFLLLCIVPSEKFIATMTVNIEIVPSSRSMVLLQNNQFHLPVLKSQHPDLPRHDQHEN
uniref:Uncharacterized protein n=1 Tax=Timema cristinae TaxID=61476 RepID=A0A7R9GV80_TIMCR|nr:unnamed protein product [Timema cristinae]